MELMASLVIRVTVVLMVCTEATLQFRCRTMVNVTHVQMGPEATLVPKVHKAQLVVVVIMESQETPVTTVIVVDPVMLDQQDPMVKTVLVVPKVTLEIQAAEVAKEHPVVKVTLEPMARQVHQELQGLGVKLQVNPHHKAHLVQPEKTAHREVKVIQVQQGDQAYLAKMVPTAHARDECSPRRTGRLQLPVIGLKLFIPMIRAYLYFCMNFVIYCFKNDTK